MQLKCFYTAKRALYLLLFPILVFSLTAGACSLSDNLLNSTKEEAVGTTAAKTVEAQMRVFTATAAANISQETPAPESSPTAPTTLPEITFTPTVIPVIGSPTILARADTNCREGPDTAYRRLGMLLANQKSTVHGRNNDSTWWYIANPEQSGAYCWAWAGSTTISGEVTALPVMTALPTPIPASGGSGAANFTAEFSSLHECGTQAMVTFHIVNSGGVEFKSAEITIRDIQTDTDLMGPTVINNPFMDWIVDCAGYKTLPAGEKDYIGGLIPLPVPSKHKGRAFIYLCSEANLQGECIGTRLQFYFD